MVEIKIEDIFLAMSGGAKFTYRQISGVDMCDGASFVRSIDKQLTECFALLAIADSPHVIMNILQPRQMPELTMAQIFEILETFARLPNPSIVWGTQRIQSSHYALDVIIEVND